MKLWEIDEGIRECIDWEAGTIVDPERLDALQLERQKKIEGVGLYIKELMYSQSAIKAEIQALKKRGDSVERAIEGLKKWCGIALPDGAEFETGRVKLSWRRSEAVEILDEDALPKKYWAKKIVLTPDKTAIKAAISSGKTVKGATIKQKLNLQIK
ncbi:MAG: siphovirus Gp157 family protein [Clostridia bacterium]|nr:siphovirus Gp157 family protein [Clostridia bacterium]